VHIQCLQVLRYTLLLNLNLLTLSVALCVGFLPARLLGHLLLDNVANPEVFVDLVEFVRVLLGAPCVAFV